MMDRRSSLGFIYIMFINAMQVLRSMIKVVHQQLYGVGPSMAVEPMGRVTLPMTFGTVENF